MLGIIPELGKQGSLMKDEREQPLHRPKEACRGLHTRVFTKEITEYRYRSLTEEERVKERI